MHRPDLPFEHFRPARRSSFEVFYCTDGEIVAPVCDDLRATVSYRNGTIADFVAGAMRRGPVMVSRPMPGSYIPGLREAVASIGEPSNVRWMTTWRHGHSKDTTNVFAGLRGREVVDLIRDLSWVGSADLLHALYPGTTPLHDRDGLLAALAAILDWHAAATPDFVPTSNSLRGLLRSETMLETESSDDTPEWVRSELARFHDTIPYSRSARGGAGDHSWHIHHDAVSMPFAHALLSMVHRSGTDVSDPAASEPTFDMRDWGAGDVLAVTADPGADRLNRQIMLTFMRLVGTAQGKAG